MGIISDAAKSNIPAERQVAAAGLGVDESVLKETPTLLQSSFASLYPGSTRDDFKDFMGIYSPLVKQKNGDLGAELAAELGSVDPWTEAHNRYSTALGIPNPLGNKQGAMGPEQPAAPMNEQGAVAAPGQTAEEPRVPMLNKDGVLGMVKKSQVWDAMQQGYKPAKGQ
jgi:hypothetical protein